MKQERATKKQQQLLEFVTAFIKEHDYGPSYREIMRALDYKSVSTVAAHVDGLVAKGFLSRKDNSARSLAVAIGSSSVEPQNPLVKELETLLKRDDLSAEDQEAINRVKTLLQD